MITKSLNGGRIIYTFLFLLITLGLIFLGFRVQIEGSELLLRQFRELHTGSMVIIGGVGTFVLPYVTKHDVLNE
jgi:1-acyl-sn-glycerol-3-phosphate acyltransferase